MVMNLIYMPGDEFAIKIGKRIKSARERAGYTQEQIADMLQVTPHAVWYWESGRVLPRRNRLNQLASIFKVSVDWLMGRAESPADIDIADPDVALFFRKGEWEHFTDEERAFVRGAIKMAMEARKHRERQEGKGKEES